MRRAQDESGTGAARDLVEYLIDIRIFVEFNLDSKFRLD